ncbi:MAG: L,D-transpeptidase family protein [Eubacteriales bacterium]
MEKDTQKIESIEGVETEETIETEETVEIEETVETEEVLEVEEESESEDEEESEEGLEDLKEEIITEEKSEPIKTKKSVGKKIAIAFGIVVAIILVAYLIMAAFFTKYFFYGTQIDGLDYSFKTVDDVEDYQESIVDSYKLTLVTIDGNEEVITSDAIDLEYVEQNLVSAIIESQNPLMWPEMYFTTYVYTTTIEVEYDEEDMQVTIDSLACMDEDNMIDPIDAYASFEGDEYVAISYELGTVIERDIFEVAIGEAVLALETELNLEEANCYALPEVTEASTELLDLVENLNTMLQGTITYSEGEVIDEETLSTWIIIGEDNELSFDDEKITEFVSELADKYNTVGTTRTFTAADGDTAEVSGGTYGWTVDESAEIEQIKLDIASGEAVEREISYSKEAISHGEMDWGNTYTEIDLTDQKVYYILDGEVVVEGSIVTGDVDGGNATPQGVYPLSYKTTNAVLRGTQYADGTYAYESPVSYWMPFNGGIGMHDASWRSEFGGTIYQTSGSHGCVNMTYSTAQAIYSYISSGDPIICHY